MIPSTAVSRTEVAEGTQSVFLENWEFIYEADSGLWYSLAFRDDKGCVSMGQAIPMSPFSLKLFEKEWTAEQAQSFRLIETPDEITWEWQDSSLRVVLDVFKSCADPMISFRIRVHAIGNQSIPVEGICYRYPALTVDPLNPAKLFAPGQPIAPGSSDIDLVELRLNKDVKEPLPSLPEGWFLPTPDQSPGWISLDYEKSEMSFSIWMQDHKATAFPKIYGVEQGVSIEFEHQLADLISEDRPLTSEGPNLYVSSGGTEPHRIRVMANSLSSEAINRNEVDHFRLIQIVPHPKANWTKHLHGAALQDWIPRLEQMRDLGFNVVYCLPVWLCQDGLVYAVTDHYQVDPEIGTEADVREFVDRAHELGMKVLFDYIPQGIGDRSPLIDEHPDWLVRDRWERPFGSHGWGPKPGAPKNGHTYSLDWGHEDIQDFMLDWAEWMIRTFDIDGFRTDAMHWKEPNFSKNNPNPAWQTTFGGVRLAARLRERLDSIRPGLIMLGEVAGPIFSTMHDSLYEDGWILKKLNQGWLSGDPYWTAQTWQQWNKEAEQGWPKEQHRFGFTLNHDWTSLLEIQAKSRWRCSVAIIHLLSKPAPFVFYPELKGFEAFYKEALGLRESLVNKGFNPESIRLDNADVFAVLWRHPIEHVAYLVLSHLGTNAE
ncbi:MAG: alpha-amylase family glycosyl hydrolase, partial [Verrucomicrobiota bacterium]